MAARVACSGRNRKGLPCGNPAVGGTGRCIWHPPVRNPPAWVKWVIAAVKCAVAGLVGAVISQPVQDLYLFWKKKQGLEFALPPVPLSSTPTPTPVLDATPSPTTTGGPPATVTPSPTGTPSPSPTPVREVPYESNTVRLRGPGKRVNRRRFLTEMPGRPELDPGIPDVGIDGSQQGESQSGQTGGRGARLARRLLRGKFPFGRCPDCKGKLALISYGYPGPGFFENEDYVWGGCIQFPNPTTHRCRDCQREFAFHDHHRR
jgi:hypothetical protein